MTIVFDDLQNKSPSKSLFWKFKGTHFRLIFPFYTPESSKSEFFVFRGYRKGILPWNGLHTNTLRVFHVVNALKRVETLRRGIRVETWNPRGVFVRGSVTSSFLGALQNFTEELFFNTFSTNVPLLYLLKTSENGRFSNVFSGYSLKMG